MSLLNQKLKKIIDDPIDITPSTPESTNNFSNHHSFSSKNINTYSHNYSLSLSAIPQPKGEIITEIKSRIDTFKQIKSSHKPEDLLNFDVSREGLQHFYSKSHFNKKNLDETDTKPLHTVDNRRSNEDFDISTIPKANSKPNILKGNDNTITTSKGSNENKNYFGVDLTKIFKNPKTSKQTSKVTTYKQSSIINKGNTLSGTRNYINLKSDKQRKKTYDLNNYYNEDSVENNKIKTQINLFVKQLNYNNTFGEGSLQSSEPKIHVNKTKITNYPIEYGNSGSNPNYNFTFNNSSDNESKNQTKLNINEIRNIKSCLICLTNDELRKIPNDYVQEIKELADIINTLF